VLSLAVDAAAAPAKLGSGFNRMGRIADTVAALKDGGLNLGVAYLATGRPEPALAQATALGDSPRKTLLRAFIEKGGP